MPGEVTEKLEAIKEALGDLPERLAAALEQWEGSPDGPKATAKGKLPVAQADERKFAEMEIGEFFNDPPEATPVAEDDPELENFQPTPAQRQKEREQNEFYQGLFQEAGEALDSRREEWPASEHGGAEDLGEQFVAGETGGKAAAAGGATDLSEVISLLTRIADSLDALGQREEHSNPHPNTEVRAASTGPTQWRPR
jgi:hypothetical protein